jgi:hypothetical protein
MGGQAKRFGIALGVAVLGYAAGGFGGGALVSLLSSNTHDRSVEAAMTGAFVTGPLVAVVGFVVAYLASARGGKTG